MNNYKKIIHLLKNSGWIFFDKIFRIATSLFVGIWIARYLGPENFGVLNYVYAFPLLFSAVAGLGLTNILFNEFVVQKNDSQLKTTFFTSIISKLISGLISLVLVIILSVLIDRDKTLVLLVSISSISLITQSLDVVDTYFQSQRKVKYSIIPKLVVFIFATGLRVIGLENKYGIAFFVLITSTELIFSSAASFFISIKYLHVKLSDFRMNFTILKDLLNRSWPLMVSEIFLFLYVRVDLLMIKHLSTDSEVGNYSVAMRVTDLWYFIPMALTASLYPSIIILRQNDYKEYLSRYSKMLSAFALISISIGILLTVVANPLIHFLYGDRYNGVGSVLTISVWTGLFVFLDVGVSNWFISESLQRYVLNRTIIGAIINVLLNFVLIPHFGATGSAVATLIAQLCASYLMNGLYSKTKEVFMLQTNALLFFPKFVKDILLRAF